MRNKPFTKIPRTKTNEVDAPIGLNLLKEVADRGASITLSDLWPSSLATESLTTGQTPLEWSPL